MSRIQPLVRSLSLLLLQCITLVRVCVTACMLCVYLYGHGHACDDNNKLVVYVRLHFIIIIVVVVMDFL